MDTTIHVASPLNTGDRIITRQAPEGMRVSSATGSTLTVEHPAATVHPPVRTIFRTKEDKRRIRRFRKLQKARGNR